MHSIEIIGIECQHKREFKFDPLISRLPSHPNRAKAGGTHWIPILILFGRFQAKHYISDELNASAILYQMHVILPWIDDEARFPIESHPPNPSHRIYMYA